MCGIIGIVGTQPVAPLLLDGLRRLEYRGYDSAGIATLDNQALHVARAAGKLHNLAATLDETPLPGHTGIGHTRWATHGMATVTNAHPHAGSDVAVVHNGIIENYQPLKKALQDKGYSFASETDSEVVAHLLEDKLKSGLAIKQAIPALLAELEGAFALAIIIKGEENLLIGARRGSPLVIGYGDTAMYLGSDALALAPLTRRISYLLEDDWCILSQNSAALFDQTGNTISRDVVDSGLSGAMIGKGRHRHFMLKEIYEQPTVLGDTLNVFLDPASGDLRLPPLPLPLNDIKQISLVGCGTSYHAGLTARYWLENIAGVPVRVDIASEYRYRAFCEPAGTLGIFISQSGETADTLAAMRFAQAHNMPCMAVVNVPSSSMAREADIVLPTLAGPEIGVASTKAFTTQLMVLAVVSLVLAKARGKDTDTAQQSLLHVPALSEQLLEQDAAIAKLASQWLTAQTMLYIGRGSLSPIAQEGALKLKELSYIHAEGFAAGELKHGPIALLDDGVPVIVLAPDDPLSAKTLSNMQEVAARGAKILLIGAKNIIDTYQDSVHQSLVMPDMTDFISPLLYSLPIQFLAYHIAVQKGTDVDQPRNLAKSVTVE